MSLVKQAAKKNDDRPKAGFIGRNMAVTRAMRAGESGPGLVLVKPELVGLRLRKGLKTMGRDALTGGLIGGVGSHVLGRSVGKGALAGAGLGAMVGSTRGQLAADKEYLAKRGITSNLAGLSNKLSPKAEKKYLHKKYRGGGYDG